MQLIPLNDRAWIVEDFLSTEECARLIARAEEAGFEPAGVRTTQGQQALPQVRNNERVVIELPDTVALLWSRLKVLDLPEVGGRQACGLPKPIRFYKYGPGQRFRMHKDGPWEEGGLSSELTLLVYLNEDVKGGETVFKDAQVKPQTGLALLFLHKTWHEGAAVEAGVKYVLRSDVLYH